MVRLPNQLHASLYIKETEREQKKGLLCLDLCKDDEITLTHTKTGEFLAEIYLSDKCKVDHTPIAILAPKHIEIVRKKARRPKG